MVEEIHIFFSDLVKIILCPPLHRLGFYPVPIRPVGTVSGYLPKIYLRIKVCGKRISMISAITVKYINGVDFIKIMFLRICRKYRCDTRVKPASKNCGKSCLLEFFLISPLPGIIKVSSKSQFFAPLLINFPPLGILRILALVVCGINIVNSTGKTCIHNRKILIRECHIEHCIRPVRTDQCF